MTPTTDASASSTDSPSLAIAGQIIDGLAARDFDAVVDALADDVHLRALLPSRTLEVEGSEAARATFDAWFSGVDHWDMVEAIVGEVGGRMHLRWRLHVTNPDVGPGNFLVEQQVYADAGADGRLREIALLCTGYRRLPS